MIVPGRTRLAWIGAGVMGRGMCARLLAAGFQATVYSRTRAKAEPLLALGAAWADDAKSAAANADVVFTMLGYPADVRQVVLEAGGVLQALQPGAVLVDMTTSEPKLAVEIAKAAAAVDVSAIDAPVSGGDIGAREGRLSIMVGGAESTVRELEPCWQAMGKTVVHHGPSGSGQHAKLANQILVAGNMIGVCESLLYAQKAGLNLNRVLESTTPGAAGSWSLSNLGPRIIQGNFEPGFYVEHFIKDMRIALAEATRFGLRLPGLTLAEQLYARLAELGHARSGTQALVLALAEMSNTQWSVNQSEA